MPRLVKHKFIRPAKLTSKWIRVLRCSLLRVRQKAQMYSYNCRYVRHWLNAVLDRRFQLLKQRLAKAMQQDNHHNCWMWSKGNWWFWDQNYWWSANAHGQLWRREEVWIQHPGT